MLLQKTLLALASCSLFSVAAFAQTPPSPYQNVAASSCNRDMVLRRSPSLVNTSATKRADIIGRQTVPAFRKATVKRRISSSITSTLISLGLLCRKKKGKKRHQQQKMLSILSSSPTISSGSGMRPPRMLLTTTIRMPLKPPSRTGSFVPPVMSALNGMSVRKSGMTNPV